MKKLDFDFEKVGSSQTALENILQAHDETISDLLAVVNSVDTFCEIVTFTPWTIDELITAIFNYNLFFESDNELKNYLFNTIVIDGASVEPDEIIKTQNGYVIPLYY